MTIPGKAAQIGPAADAGVWEPAANVAAKMNRTTWPRNAARYAKTTAKVLTSDAIDYGKYAECTTIDEMDQVESASSSENPGAGLRRALGLGSAPSFAGPSDWEARRASTTSP